MKIKKPLNRPLILQEKPDPATCEHEWHVYKKYLGADKNMRQHTLIIRGCPKCKSKRAIDLKVE